jgi:GrpB-like predicted nucleotidyltransferase (UPF0157 family)
MVVLFSHDPGWSGMFAAESSQIMDVLRPNAIQIHHIGSTAIPVTVAKPIVDMLVVVHEINAVDGCSESMQAMGYQVMGEYGIPGRRYFRKDNSSGVRTHHLHVFAQGSAEIICHLAFRDFMNAHHEFAEKYSRLKQTLATRPQMTSENYQNGKSVFVREMVQRALEWSGEIH